MTRTLAPLSALAEGLARLARGDRSLLVSRGGSPELVAIAEGINALAASLARLDDENHRLLRRMIDVQEDERRDIARDLHDEIGPFLFAIRAGVGALRRRAASAGSNRIAPGSTRRSPLCNRSTAACWRGCAPPRWRIWAFPARSPRSRRAGARAIPESR